jgi:hypothetical protein
VGGTVAAQASWYLVRILREADPVLAIPHVAALSLLVAVAVAIRVRLSEE